MARIYFDAGAGAFTLTGNSIKLQTNGANTPLIQNDSTSLQTLRFANLALANSGTINAAAGDITMNLGSGTGSLYLDGNSALTLQAAAGKLLLMDNIVANGGGSVGSLIADGSGTVRLTRTNSYTGGTTINSGATLQVGNGGSTGTLGAGSITNNGTLTWDHGAASSNTIFLSGTANPSSLSGSGGSYFRARAIDFQNVTGGVWSSNTTGNQTYIATGIAAGQGLIFNNGASTYNFTATGGASITMTGDIGGNSAPTSGGPTVNIDTSSGNGTINLDISVGRVNQFWNIKAINANAGTGAINWTGTNGAARSGNTSQVTPITLTGAINMTSDFAVHGTNGLTLTMNATGTSTVSGVLSGKISLTKGGAEDLTLSGANTYYGGTTTISSGRLIIHVASGTNDYGASGSNNFVGTGTLVKSGAGSVRWGNATTFNFSSGALIDVQGGTFTGGSGANEVWTNNKADLNVASGAIFDGVEGSSLANGGIFVDALSGAGTIKIGYTAGGPYGDTITFGVDNGSGSFGGVLSNSTTAGKWVKTGTGTQTLTGTSTATGLMTINNGTLALGHATNTLANTMPVTVDGAGAILSIAGNSDTVGAVTLKNGASITGTGGTLTGASYAVESGTVSAKLGGTGIALTKSTGGTVTLSGANTYTGSTTVSTGRLIVASTSNTSSTSIASGATLELNKASGTTSFTATTSFTGAGTIVKTGAGRVTWLGAATFNMSSGALIDVQEGTFTAADNGDDTWINNKADLNVAAGATFDGVEAGSVANGGIFVDALSGAGTIKVGYYDEPPAPAYANKLTFGVDNGSGTFSGVLADSESSDPNAHGSFTKTGTGTQTLTGTSTATGTMTVNNGTLALGHATNTLADTMAVSVDGASAILSIAGNSDTVGAVTLKNGASITGSGGTLTGASYAVESGSVTAKLGGTGIALTKSTGGTVTLSGANTYTGATTVNAGTLVIDGSVTSDVTVGSSGTLGGSGTITGNLVVSGTHNPGNSPGIQTVTGDATYNSSSIFNWELVGNTSTQSGSAPYNFDQVAVTGALSIDSAAVFNIVLNGAGSAVDFTNGFWASNQSWSIFTGATALSGFTLGTVSADSLSQNAGTYGSFSINGSTLSWTAVPEPGSAVAGLLLGAGLLRRRRQRL